MYHTDCFIVSITYIALLFIYYHKYVSDGFYREREKHIPFHYIIIKIPGRKRHNIHVYQISI